MHEQAWFDKISHWLEHCPHTEPLTASRHRLLNRDGNHKASATHQGMQNFHFYQPYLDTLLALDNPNGCTMSHGYPPLATSQGAIFNGNIGEL